MIELTVVSQFVEGKPPDFVFEVAHHVFEVSFLVVDIEVFENALQYRSEADLIQLNNSSDWTSFVNLLALVHFSFGHPPGFLGPLASQLLLILVVLTVRLVHPEQHVVLLVCSIGRISCNRLHSLLVLIT